MVQQALSAETEYVASNERGKSPWPDLEEWLNWSNAWRTRIARRAEREPSWDDWDARNEWEVDRYVLIKAFEETPAPSARELQLKARLAQFPYSPFDGRPFLGAEALMKAMVENLLALPVEAVGGAEVPAGNPRLVAAR